MALRCASASALAFASSISSRRRIACSRSSHSCSAAAGPRPSAMRSSVVVMTAITSSTPSQSTAPLNIGGLWSDEPQLEGGALHEARREVLLYLILLEPGLAPAIKTAKALSLADGP